MAECGIKRPLGSLSRYIIIVLLFMPTRVEFRVRVPPDAAYM